MHIKADKSTINYSGLTAVVKTDSKSTNNIKNQSFPKDTLELSNSNKTIANMLSTDKGTASHTTLYVDNATFQQIATYSTNHPETQWSEIGKDSEKRWIVVNGQRFESPLSEEEKAIAKRAQMSLLDYLEEAAERKEETSQKEEVTLDFANKNDLTNTSNDPKINGLLQNEKVMEMLKNISKSSKGKIALSF